MADAGVADFLGVAKGAVSKWRSGATSPSKDRIQALESLLSEHKSGRTGKLPGNPQETLAPVEHESMPEKGPAYMSNDYSKHSDAPYATGADANIKAPATPE